MNAPPDYASCSLTVLMVLRGRINRRKFPERYQEVDNLIQERQTDLTDDERQLFEERMQHNRNVRLFSFAFLVAGPLAFLFYVVVPLWDTAHTMAWAPTTCVVSYNSPHPSNRQEIYYKYTYRGQSYISNTLTRSVDDRKTKKWVDQYPDGAQTQCYVNPFHPEQATLSRDIGGAPPFFLIWSVFITGVSLYAFLRPEQTGFNHRNPFTQKELRRISFEDILNRDEK